MCFLLNYQNVQLHGNSNPLSQQTKQQTLVKINKIANPCLLVQALQHFRAIKIGDRVKMVV
jgi:hypothetical protein